MPNRISVGGSGWEPGKLHAYELSEEPNGLRLTPKIRPYIELSTTDAIVLAEYLLRFARLHGMEGMEVHDA